MWRFCNLQNRHICTCTSNCVRGHTFKTNINITTFKLRPPPSQSCRSLQGLFRIAQHLAEACGQALINVIHYCGLDSS